MAVLIEGVLDVGAGDKQLEGVVNVRIVEAFGLHALDLFHAFLLVRTETELLLVAPEDSWLNSEVLFGEDVMKVDHLIARAVTHNHKNAALIAVEAVVDAGLNPGVHLFLHRVEAMCQL